MGRMPVTPRLSAIAPRGCPQGAARRITRRFHRLCASGWWVAYALRTRPPLSRHPKVPIPYDLHVLGLPLAFILSQDQTLRCTIAFLKLTSVSWAPLSTYLLRFLILHPSCLLGLQVDVLCWPQAFKDLSPHPTPSLQPLFLRLRAAKIQPFQLLAMTFFEKISIFLQLTDCQNEKFSCFSKIPVCRTHYLY